jgi:hypothetical protein
MKIVVAVVVLLVIGIVALFVAVNRHHQRVLAQWEGWATSHGLAFEPSAGPDRGPRIEGRLEGREVVIAKDTYGAPEDSRTVTLVYLAPKGMPRGLGLLPTGSGASGAVVGWMVGLARASGAGIPPEVDLGDEEFESRWRVHGHDADEVRAWMESPERRRALVEVIESETFFTRESFVIGEFPNLFKPEELDRALALVSEVVVRFEHGLP